MANAIAGAHARGGKGKSNFADVLASILSAQPAQSTPQQVSSTPDLTAAAQTATTQDNVATPFVAGFGNMPDAIADAHRRHGRANKSDLMNSAVSGQTAVQTQFAQNNAPAQQRAAQAQVTDALNANTAANGDTTDTSANAISALAAKLTDTKSTDTAPAATDASHHKHAAFAMVKDALNASTAAQGDTSDDSADAVSALAAKITGTNTGNSSAPQAAATAQPVQPTDGKHIHTNAKHATLTAATQAKLVSALAHAATAPTKIVGSDGKTAASSDSKGTPADPQAPQTTQAQPAPSQTAADTNKVLAAMQTAQPVVTTVATNADKTEATVTPRTMTQLEKAALGNSAQQALHSAAPAAKTETQALTMAADAKQAHIQDNNGAQTGSGQKQSHNSDSFTASAAKTSDAQSAKVPDAPQPASNAPAAPTASSPSATDAASAMGNNGASQAVPPTTVATTLQVAQHSAASSSSTSDLAALGVTIAAKSKDGHNEFNIRMDPADLGRVDVRLSVDATGKAQAHLTADKPETLALLQRDSHTLERTLKDSGLDLANNGLNFSLKGEQQSSTPTFIARNRALSINSVQTTDTVSTSSSTSTAPGDSRLDIRV